MLLKRKSNSDKLIGCYSECANGMRLDHDLVSGLREHNRYKTVTKDQNAQLIQKTEKSMNTSACPMAQYAPIVGKET